MSYTTCPHNRYIYIFSLSMISKPQLRCPRCHPPIPQSQVHCDKFIVFSNFARPDKDLNQAPHARQMGGSRPYIGAVGQEILGTVGCRISFAAMLVAARAMLKGGNSGTLGWGFVERCGW